MAWSDDRNGFLRVVTCSTTSASTTLVATTGEFAPDDVGATVTGTGIPSSTVIDTYTDSTHVEMSNAATADGTGIAVTVTPA